MKTTPTLTAKVEVHTSFLTRKARNGRQVKTSYTYTQISVEAKLNGFSISPDGQSGDFVRFEQSDTEEGTYSVFGDLKDFEKWSTLCGVVDEVRSELQELGLLETFRAARKAA